MWVERCLHHTSGRKGAREGAVSVLEEGGHWEEAQTPQTSLPLESDSSFLGQYPGSIQG